MTQKIDISVFEDNVATAKNIKLRNQLLIEGVYQDAQGGNTIDVASPHNGEVICKMASAQIEDVDKAVLSARAAFEDGRWTDIAPQKKKEILLKWADLIEENHDEIAFLKCLEMGKPIKYATTIDKHMSTGPLRYAAESIDKIYGQVATTASHAIGTITREPMGVVGAITPWNFPVMMSSWKFAPALAVGNSVVVKPAEQTPLSILKIGDLALEAGIPPGVFNIIPGEGHIAGKALALHNDVDCIGFTGSGEVAKLLLQYSGQSNMKRITAETGGKTPNIIFEDAYDIDYAAWQAAFGVFYNTGAMCVAGSRVLVQESIVEKVTNIIKSASTKMKSGNPLDAKTRMGPVIDKAQFDKIMNYIKVGQEEGATLEIGGQQELADSGGYYCEATVLGNVKNEMRVAQEEIFGPVICIIPFKDEEDAIRIANDSQYGLAAAIWTSDMARGLRMSRKIKAGSVWINNWEGHDQTVPFGGYKQSGIGGKDKTIHAFDKYSHFKTTWIHIDGKGVRNKPA